MNGLSVCLFVYLFFLLGPSSEGNFKYPFVLPFGLVCYFAWMKYASSGMLEYALFKKIFFAKNIHEHINFFAVHFRKARS